MFKININQKKKKIQKSRKMCGGKFFIFIDSAVAKKIMVVLEVHVISRAFNRKTSLARLFAFCILLGRIQAFYFLFSSVLFFFSSFLSISSSSPPLFTYTYIYLFLPQHLARLAFSLSRDYSVGKSLRADKIKRLEIVSSLHSFVCIKEHDSHFS